MDNSFVSFSNGNSVDFFPTFKSFSQPTDDQGAFTIDKRDIEEMKTKSETNSVQKTKKSKRPNVAVNSSDQSNSIAQCDICSVPISGPIVYDSHTKGKKHQTQLAAILVKNPEYKPPTYEELCSRNVEPTIVNNQTTESTSNPNDPPLIASKKFNCNLCNVSCNSQQMFDNHVAGRKHQVKVKANILTKPAPPRMVPDNNPSSSNYCDVCSLQLNSEDELTAHLSHKRHQTRTKEAESCAKDAADMNINFDNYKISITDNDKDKFDYQCTICVKKFTCKRQLIDHLKSALHIQLSSRSNNKERLSNKPTRGAYQTSRGGFSRGGSTTRGQSLSSFRGSNRSSGKSRPCRAHVSSWNQTSQVYEQYFNEQTPSNPFGAFDPNNEAIYSSNDNNNNYYSSTKRSAQYEQNTNDYDRGFSKRARTYNNDNNTSQNYYSNNQNYYPPQTNDYSNQSVGSQPAWQYPSESYYEQHQYSNPDTSYTNSMQYQSNQPPLPDYAPPPLPNYPPPPSHTSYPQNSAFHGDTGNQGNSNYYQNSFPH